MRKRLGTFTLEKRSCETWSRGALCPCASRSLVRRFQFALMKPSSDGAYGPDRAVPPVLGCQGGWIIQSLGLLEPLQLYNSVTCHSRIVQACKHLHATEQMVLMETDFLFQILYVASIMMRLQNYSCRWCCY